MKSSGFTLLELLIVMAIIGIIASIFSWGFIRNIRTSELREAATQVAADFRRARSQAQRQSKDIVLVLPNGTGGTTYKVDTENKTISNGIRVSCTTSCAGANVNVTYQAPYGELGSGATGNVFTLTSPMNGITPYEIRIVGVTGKVILTRTGS